MDSSCNYSLKTNVMNLMLPYIKQINKERSTNLDLSWRDCEFTLHSKLYCSFTNIRTDGTWYISLKYALRLLEFSSCFTYNNKWFRWYSTAPMNYHHH